MGFSLRQTTRTAARNETACKIEYVKKALDYPDLDVSISSILKEFKLRPQKIDGWVEIGLYFCAIVAVLGGILSWKLPVFRKPELYAIAIFIGIVVISALFVSMRILFGSAQFQADFLDRAMEREAFLIQSLAARPEKVLAEAKDRVDFQIKILERRGISSQVAIVIATLVAAFIAKGMDRQWTYIGLLFLAAIFITALALRDAVEPLKRVSYVLGKASKIAAVRDNAK